MRATTKMLAAVVVVSATASAPAIASGWWNSDRHDRWYDGPWYGGYPGWGWGGYRGWGWGGYGPYGYPGYGWGGGTPRTYIITTPGQSSSAPPPQRIE
jgi:hypothetical protein